MDAQLPQPTPSTEKTGNQKKSIAGVIIAFVVLILLTAAFLFFLFSASPERIVYLRDIFIIFMAIQSILIGLVLVILILQVARLINLLQNEIKPILDSTNETVSTLRGTAEFLSDNLASPVIKLNEYLAGLTQVLAILGLGKKNPKSKHKE